MGDITGRGHDFSGNREMEMARDFVRHTGRHIFLTGRAGTGKTTFLKSLKAACGKQMVVTAPTGVAAVNAGGVTLHSFFQLPFGPYVPGRTDMDSRRMFRFSKEKRRIISGLDLLVIDEISMVRADLLDAVDEVLRRLRRDERPFGGVQLLLIGDLFQLPPVAKPEEWQLLQDLYDSVYFFSSRALAAADLVTIELKKIYRQSDREFIRLLNRIRDGRLDEHSADLLARCADKPLPEQGYITLTTHNKKADAINRKRLDRIEGASRELTAEVSGEFPDHSFPTPDRLILKPGAQVMFLKNDPSPERAFYNGKIGRVAAIEKDKVIVLCDADGERTRVEVTPMEWENVAYRVRDEDQTIEETVIGRYRQFPLKLAWAVTIHKSQGLTFDRAVVDARDAFAHGQTYVALSRCRSLDGLVLSSPVPDRGLGGDPAVTAFMAGTCPAEALSERFRQARIEYQQELLLRCFDCGTFRGLFYYAVRLVEENAGRVRVSGLKDAAALKSEAKTRIFEVSEKFIAQLKGMMAPDTLPETDPGIQERSQKASAWFTGTFQAVFGDLLEKGDVDTDNKVLAKQLTNGLATLKQAIRTKMAGMGACAGGFSPEAYLAAVSSAALAKVPDDQKKKAPAPDYTEFDIAHPRLFGMLKDWRSKKAQAEGVPHFQILHQKVLVQIAVCLPQTEADLAALRGVGPKTLERYGEELVSLVAAYRKEEGVKRVDPPAPKAVETVRAGESEKRPNTREITLSMSASGMDAEEIARERGLALSTVQGHLCHYIERGEVDVDRVVGPEKQAAIQAVLSDDLSIGQLKAKLGNDISYGEIKAVLARHRFLASDRD